MGIILHVSVHVYAVNVNSRKDVMAAVLFEENFREQQYQSLNKYCIIKFTTD